MRKWFGAALSLLVLALLAGGCAPTVSAPQSTPEKKDDKKNKNAGEEETIRANLEQLSPEDRKSAEEQKYCAVETHNRLGRMGPPVKIEVGGQTVFLCCPSCETSARKDEKKTLEKVERLRKQKAAP
jgi:hypothetical protein